MIRVPKRKIVLLFFLVFFLSLYVVTPVVNVRGIGPDLWVLLLLFYAFRIDWKRSPLFAFSIGLLKDLLSAHFFGLETFALGASAILLSYVLGKVERDDPLIFTVSAFLFTLVYEWIVCAGFALTSDAVPLLPYFLARSFWSAVYTVAVFPFAFLVFQSIAEDRHSFQGRVFR